MLASLACLITLLAAPDVPEIPIRAGKEITLDGKIEAAEWDDAFSIERPHPIGGKVRLRLKRTGPWLAVGVSGDREYQGEMLWIYTTDESVAWVTRSLLGIGRATLPPALWRRASPDLIHTDQVGPGEAPRGCRARVAVERPDGWSAEFLIRMTTLGLARAAEREFRGMFRLVLRQGKEDTGLITLPSDASSDRPGSFARLVSGDGWGKSEKWAPVSADVSREFDDNALLHRLFLEHEKISQRLAAVELVISNSVRPRSAARIKLLRDRLVEGRKRNPTLPAWQYFLGRLLHEANLFDEARPLVEGIPEPLRKFDPFVNLAAEHYFDTEEFNRAIEICERFPNARGMRETRDFAMGGRRAWGEELKAIARDKEKAEKNPRVRIVVRGRGDIVCELFEDDAPHAVRNFITLVQKQKYYDGLTFHEVAGGALARTGDPRTKPGATTKVDGPPWRLRPDKSTRTLLRGYLGTVPVGGGVYHGSQFLIATVPLLRETTKVAVFGRVIKGLELAETLEQDDRIERIEVISKRNHSYDPLGARLEG